MDSELPAILTLAHFCEQHGPSVLYTTQSFCMNTPTSKCDYTFPQSFARFKKEIPNLKQLKQSAEIHFCFENNASNSSESGFEESCLSPTLQSTISSISLDDEEKICKICNGIQSEHNTTTIKRKVHFDQTLCDDQKNMSCHSLSSLIEEGNSSGTVKQIIEDLIIKEETLNNISPPLPLTGDEVMKIQDTSLSSRKTSSENDLVSLEEVISLSPSTTPSPSNKCFFTPKPKVTFRKRSQSLVIPSGVNISMKKNSSIKCPSIHVTVRETQKYDPTNSPPKPSEKCPSCASIASGSGFFSPDDETHSNFISTKLPSSKNYGIIRSACVRSLSCEICPGKDGPVIFNNIGDDKNNWAVLSYMFKIRDIKSRGGARRYSFILVTEFEILVSIADQITTVFQSLANQMQQRSEILYEKQLKSTKNSPNVMNRPYSIYGGNDLPSLTELMSKKNFFSHLHCQFSSILKQIKLILTQKFYLYQSSTLKNSIPSYQFSLPAITSFKELKNALGINALQSLIFNFIIGNQIVIRGEYSLVKSIINLLQKLIPNDCCKVVEYSDTFKESWECNLLGLHLDTPLPFHLIDGSIAFVDICKYATQIDSKQIEYKFSVTGTPHRPTQLGSELEKLFTFYLPESLEKLRLKNIKTTWKNKAKLLNTLQFCLALNSESDPKIKLFQKTLNLNKDDFSILRLWAAGQKSHFRNTLKIFKSH